MRRPMNQIAQNIGMQNQYLADAVFDGKVIGEIAIDDDYHSNDSWVDVESVKQYIQWKFENQVINEESYVSYMGFLNELINSNK